MEINSVKSPIVQHFFNEIEINFTFKYVPLYIYFLLQNFHEEFKCNEAIEN